MVRRALSTAAMCNESPQLVVLPAGIGHVGCVPIGAEGWRASDRADARAAVARWVEVFAAALPHEHPPIVLGLDGAADFGQTGPCEEAIQVAAVVERRELRHVTAKSKPRNAYERGVLALTWDDDADRPAASAVADNAPVATIDGMPVLLLVCHDASAFSGRGRSAANDGGMAGVLNQQFEQAIAALHEPKLALHVIHRLPSDPEARVMTSGLFQNAHNVLHTKYGVRVVAVGGPHPACSRRAFRVLSERLRCDARHVDVLFGDEGTGSSSTDGSR